MYFFNSDGNMHIDWLKWNNKIYYFNNKTGVMCIGWADVGNKRYYFNRDGVRCYGWLNWEGKRYYLKPDGVMATESCVIGGKMYYFNPNGIWNGNNNEKTVYITRTGTKYHLSNKCGNYSYRAISLSEARAKGYTPCRRCS
jgi:glucan-binding YG repeat protein